eukprot:gnl/MRDRNA2_/MRDRNA2_95202_c0_seq1.p1 gnl/MRDRNA2_/MRDRNA2_95202_c0~~gnl/MRDRNA2_/MRDRNA2_95202_c0_seq1.p1  ORF type:complete len:133 (-),score=12.16 gnl/MRDRNA2_/MRDRNA2_95202_c0_seq1:37-435(-)
MRLVRIVLVWFALCAEARLFVPHATRNNSLDASARYWFQRVATDKECSSSRVAHAVDKKTQHGCFAKVGLLLPDVKYFSVQPEEEGESYACYSEPYGLDLNTCTEGTLDIYEIRRGEPPIETNRSATFHPFL